jgi:hypothetical protein
LRELLRQHWEHARHIEHERTWYLVSYLIGIGSLIGGAFASDNGDALKWVIPVSMLPTILGFILSIRWGDTFEEHRNRVDSTGTPIKPCYVQWRTRRFEYEYTQKALVGER